MLNLKTSWKFKLKKNVTANKKHRKGWSIKTLNSSFHVKYHSRISKSGWIRVYASISEKYYTQNCFHKQKLTIHIKIYLWSFADYQYSYKSILTTGTSFTVNLWFIHEINIRVTLSGTASSRIKCPQFVHPIISSTLKNCTWFKTLCPYSANDHALQSLKVFLYGKKNKLTGNVWLEC